MAFSVRPTALFKSQVDSTIAYLVYQLCNPTAAQALLDAIDRQFDLLAETPLVFAVDKQISELAGMPVRKVAARSYRIFYTVDEEARIVYPSAFRHATQNSSTLQAGAFRN